MDLNNVMDFIASARGCTLRTIPLEGLCLDSKGEEVVACYMHGLL